jgi:RND family efflux transporter MFP subunit
MFTVARTDKMRIIAQIPERDVPYTNVGDRATVELDALAGTEFHGTVARFANSEDRNTRTMRAEIDLENKDNRLRDGMFGRVTIFVDEASKGLTVPSSSVVADTKSKKSSVYVVQDGKLKKTPVEIGQDDGIRVEIVSGLNPTDQVVRRPTAEMSDGLAVEVEGNEKGEILADSSPRG